MAVQYKDLTKARKVIAVVMFIFAFFNSAYVQLNTPLLSTMIEPLFIKAYNAPCKIADSQTNHFRVAHIIRNIAVVYHIVRKHFFSFSINSSEPLARTSVR